MQRPMSITLAQTWLPRVGVQYDALRVVLGSLFVAICAQITIPLQPVPITGQTLAVLLVGAALGSRLGALAMLAYLSEGLAGLPVFASFNSAWTPSSMGMPVIVGPTAGYLVGFVVAAFVVGWLAERGWDRQAWSTVVAMVIGNAIIYLFGVAWLSTLLQSVSKGIQFGMLPFLVGDAIKIAIAAGVLPGAWVLSGPRKK